MIKKRDPLWDAAYSVAAKENQSGETSDIKYPSWGLSESEKNEYDQYKASKYAENKDYFDNLSSSTTALGTSIYSRLKDQKYMSGDLLEQLQKDIDTYSHNLRLLGTAGFDTAGALSGIHDVSAAYGQKKKLLSQFGDEKAYNAAIMDGSFSYGDDKTDRQNRIRVYSENQKRINELNQQIDALGNGDASALEEERDALETQNRQYERTFKITDDSAEKYLGTSDYQKYSGKRDFNNPSASDWQKYDNRNDSSTWKYGAGGKIYNVYGEEVTDGDIYHVVNGEYVVNTPRNADPLGAFFAADKSGELQDAIATPVDAEDSYTKFLKDANDAAWQELTEDEIGIYYTILNIEGADAAVNYLHQMTPTTTRRYALEQQGKIQNADWLTLAAYNVLSVPMQMVGSVSSGIEDAAAMVGAADYNPYSKAHSFQNDANAVRSSTANRINEKTDNGKFLGITLGDVYQFGMSAVDSAVGAATMGNAYTVLMGMGAASNKAKELYDRGASEGQIITNSLISGAIEIATEYISIDKLVKMKDTKAVSELLKNILVQSGIEASEEFFGELADTAADAIIMGSQSEYEQGVQALMKEKGISREKAALEYVGENVWKATAGGFLSGGLSAGVMSTAGYAVQAPQMRQLGQDIIDNGGADALRQLAYDVAGAENVEKSTSKDLSKQADKLGKKQTAQRVGYLSQMVDSARSEQNISDIAETLIKEGMSKRAAHKAAETIVAFHEDGYSAETADKYSRLLDSNRKAASVAESFYGENSDSSVAKNNLQHRIARTGLASYKDMNAVSSTAESKIESVKQTFKASDNGGNVIAVTGEKITDMKVESVKDGKMTMRVTLEDGKTKTVDASKIDYASQDKATIYGYLAENNMVAGAVQTLVDNYTGKSDADLKTYLLGVEEAYQYGYYGRAMQNLQFAQDLAPNQRTAAFRAGQIAAQMDLGEENARVKRAQAQAAIQQKGHRTDGRVSFEGDQKSFENLSQRQQATVDLAQQMAKVFGNHYHFFVSQTVDGKHILDGKEVENGWYDTRSGDIWVDLNAGAKGEGLALFTLTHELTHFIRQWAPSQFRALSAALVTAYEGKNVPISQLVRSQQELARKHGRRLSYDEAWEEVVANSMEGITQDGRLYEAAMQLKQENRTLWQKVKDWFADILARLKKAYAGLTPDSREANLMLQMTDQIEAMQKAWAEGLNTASQNFKSADGTMQGEKNTATEGGKVQYSLRLMNNETDEQKADRLKNASMVVTIASEESIKAANKVGANRITATEAKKVLKEITEKFDVAGRYSNNILEIDFDYSNTAIQRSYSHQAFVTGLDFSGQAIVQANIKDIAKNAYPVEAHADEKPKNIQNTIPQVITLAGAVQAGHDAIFVKMTVKLPSSESNRLHMVVTSEIKKGLDITITTGATESHPAGKSNPTISLQQYFENVNSLPEFIKRIPIDLIIKNNSNQTTHLIDEKNISTAVDTDGKSLSEGQQKYFAGSKVRDADGKLRVMYQGSTEEFTVFDKKKSKPSNLYGRGFYFTDSKVHASQYGNARAYYLNITNPLSNTENSISKSQLTKFVAEIAENEDYGIENYGYDATVKSVVDSVWGKSDFAMLQDISATCVGDLVAATKLFNEINGTSYDGFILDTETVTFDSNQAKLTTNESPTENEDMRFSARQEESYSTKSILTQLNAETVSQLDADGKKLLQSYQRMAKRADYYRNQIDQLRAEKNAWKGKSIHAGSVLNSALASKNAEINELQRKLENTEKIMAGQVRNPQIARLVNTARDQAVKQLREEKNAKIAQIRQEKNAQIDKVRTQYQTSIANAREGRAVTELRGKIRRVAEDIKGRITAPSDARYIPLGLAQSVVDLSDILDYAPAEGTKARAKYDSVSEAVRAVADEYRKLAKDDDYAFSSEFDEVLHEQIGTVAETLKGRNIRELTKSELQQVYDAVKIVRDTLRSATKLIGVNGAQDVYEAADSVVAQQENIQKLAEDRGKANKLLHDLLHRSNLDGISFMRAVEMLSGWDKNSTLYQLVAAIEDGKEVSYDYVMKYNKLFQFLKTGKNEKTYHDATNKRMDIGIKDTDGKPVLMTKMQIMQAIMTWDREAHNDKLAHMQETGIKVRNANLIQDGKVEEASKTAQLVKITPEMISEMRSRLSAWDKQFMVKIRNYFKGETTAVNDVMYQLKHRVLQAEEFYIPEVVDSNYLIAELGKDDTFNIFVKEPGATNVLKTRAKQPIIIDGLETVMSKHVTDMGNYVGMAIPIRNFAKVFNGMNLNMDEPMSVKDSISKSFGDHANEVLMQGMRDVQGGRSQTRIDRLSRKMTGLYSAFNKLALVGKAGVTIKQAASYQSAGSIVSRRALILGNRAFVNSTDQSHSFGLISQLFMSPDGKTAQRLFNEIDQHTPLHYQRRLGMSMQEIAFEKLRSTKSKRFLQGVGASLEQNKLGSFVRSTGEWLNPVNWIQRMDVATTGALWVACKYQAKLDGYKIGSDEFWTHTTDLYKRVIRETQPMYDSLHRAEVQKGEGFTKYLFPFKTVPFQNKGQIFSAIGAYASALKTGTKAETKAAAKYAYNTVAANVRSAMIFAALSLVAGAVQHKMKRYRDDDDELTLSSVGETYFGDFLGVLASNASPLFGNEIIEFISGRIDHARDEDDSWAYDLFQVGMLDLINDTYESLVAFTDGAIDLFRGDMAFGDFANVASSAIMQFAAFFGIPAQNVVDLFSALSLHIQDTQGDGFLSFSSDKPQTKKNNSASLYKAMVSGNTADIEKYSAQFDTDKKLHNAIRDQLKKNDARITDAAVALNNGNVAEYERIIKEIVGEGHFDQDDVVSAIRSQKDSIKNAIAKVYDMFFGDGTEDATARKMYSTEDYVNAATGGQAASANNAKEYLISDYMDKGATREEAENNFYSSVCSEITKRYKNDDYPSDQNYINLYIQYGGMSEQKAADKVKELSFSRQNPDYDWSVPTIDLYYDNAQPAGISMQVFDNFITTYNRTEPDYDGNGNAVKNSKMYKVAEYIESLDIPKEQKETLFLCEYSQKSLKKVRFT